MTDAACDLKIQALQIKHDTLAREFETHKAEVNTIRQSMFDIQKTLLSIKYSIMGAFGFYILQSIGLIELIKAFVK